MGGSSDHGWKHSGDTAATRQMAEAFWKNNNLKGVDDAPTTWSASPPRPAHNIGWHNAQPAAPGKQLVSMACQGCTPATLDD